MTFFYSTIFTALFAISLAQYLVSKFQTYTYLNPAHFSSEMAPSTPSKGTDDARAAEAVETLCHLIMSCDGFKGDNRKVAEKLGVGAKNLPRKINSLVNPHGFHYSNGKLTCNVEDDDNTPTTSPAKKATAEGTTTPKAKTNKKRKFKADKEPSVDNDVDAEGDDDDGAQGWAVGETGFEMLDDF